MRVQPVGLLGMVIVESQSPAGDIGQLEHAVQRGIEPARDDFRVLSIDYISKLWGASKREPWPEKVIL